MEQSSNYDDYNSEIEFYNSNYKFSPSIKNKILPNNLLSKKADTQESSKSLNINDKTSIHDSYDNSENDFYSNNMEHTDFSKTRHNTDKMPKIILLKSSSRNNYKSKLPVLENDQNITGINKNNSKMGYKNELSHSNEELDSSNNESIDNKINKILNKLNLFISNFKKLGYEKVFSKHLIIDSELITYDLIKKFEDEIKNNKLLIKDLALDLTEFYPKYKLYKKAKEGRIRINKKNCGGKYTFLQKLIQLSPIFEGIVPEELFVDNFIFFEPLSQFIQENINSHIKNLEVSKKVLNFTQPELLFPLARKIKRKFIYHMGPTNSGKTSNALKSLQNAKNGIYLAPLRLLAWEVYEKLKKNNVKCTLLTGQDKVFCDDQTHYSMTIEKCDFKKKFEVAVIDEIQMIEDDERGSAWTNAILGVLADEIHLCGDERGLYLIKQLCDKTGDELHYKRYSRFSNLIVEDKVFDYNDLRKGDCIIAFAKTKIMDIKKRVIETKSGNIDVCAVIYGDLPAETKKDQAKMFNELTFSPSHNEEIKYDYLVSSDAVKLIFNNIF